MTVHDFWEICKTRIPTPVEFVDFIESQGWKVILRDDGSAALRADAGKEICKRLARMMSREPYRSGVIETVKARGGKPVPPRQISHGAIFGGAGKGTQPARTAVKAREWRWQYDQRYTETPSDEWLWGHADRHPAGATHWRYVGQSEWTPVTREGVAP